MEGPRSGVPPCAEPTYEELAVARSTVRIHLGDRARQIALEPPPRGASSLHPSARAALEQAEPGPGGAPLRVVRCTLPEARSLLDFFSTATDALKGLRDADAEVCAVARDSVRRAIVTAGA